MFFILFCIFVFLFSFCAKFKQFHNVYIYIKYFIFVRIFDLCM